MVKIIACVEQACKDLGIDYEFIDANHNVICVKLAKRYYFLNNISPFCRADIGRICKDKEFLYKIVHKHIAMPLTKGYLDPGCREDYHHYLTVTSHEAMIEEIIKTFGLPVIIKPNRGSTGTNVFKCEDREQIARAAQTIFNKQDRNYDYITLAQEYIAIKKEYRVILFYDDILIIYEKNIDNATFTGNISPLHHENSRAIWIKDEALKHRIKQFIAPLYELIEVTFLGLDIVIDHDGEMHLLEINSQPEFKRFIMDNGKAPIVALYKILLKRLINAERI